MFADRQSARIQAKTLRRPFIESVKRFEPMGSDNDNNDAIAAKFIADCGGEVKIRI
jgi:hypothetical protein